jgi:hypothetical protein
MAITVTVQPIFNLKVVFWVHLQRLRCGSMKGIQLLVSGIYIGLNACCGVIRLSEVQIEGLHAAGLIMTSSSSTCKMRVSGWRSPQFHCLPTADWPSVCTQPPIHTR